MPNIKTNKGSHLGKFGFETYYLQESYLLMGMFIIKQMLPFK